MILHPEEIARITHEANRAYCAALGDNSQPSWDEAPEWHRIAVLAGVLHALRNPGSTPRNSHESWLAQKTAEGWSYGPVKDVDAKTHPCFLPYDELPATQKLKDHLFLAIVRTFA